MVDFCWQYPQPVNSSDYLMLHLRDQPIPALTDFVLYPPIHCLENLRCYCKFHRQYLLLCRHIFHLDSERKVLTASRWEAYVLMFEEGGMEVNEQNLSGAGEGRSY